MANVLYQHETRKELSYLIDEEDEAMILSVTNEGYVLVEPEEVEEPKKAKTSKKKKVVK